MMNFTGNIVERRYFDHNGKRASSIDTHAAITIARTEGNNYGDYWHALDAEGYRIGQAKTVESAVKIGSTKVISDAAMTANIKIKRGDMHTMHTRYSQKVFVDGVHVATFTPSYGREYTLRDVSGETVCIQGTGHHRHVIAEVSGQSEMTVTVRRWLELIPNDDDIADRKTADLAADDALAAEIAEGKRIDLIKDNAEDLLEALEGAADRLENMLHLDTHNVIKIAHDNARAVIKKARGE